MKLCDPPLQAIPLRTPTARELRRALVEKHPVEIQADYESIEMRFLAEILRKP